MTKLLALLAALLLASPASAQSYPSPTYTNVTIAGALFFNNCAGIVVGNGSTAATCASPVPSSYLPVGTSGATIPLMSTINTWGATQNFAAITATAISTSGHVWGTGSAPAISSCGTGPTASTGMNDAHGTVTTGTGTVTSCTITFAAAYTNTPDCVLKTNSANTITTYTVSNTALTPTFSASSASTKWSYICMGN